MADETGPAPAAPNGAPDPDDMPQVRVLAQYVKDMSFENPNAPEVYQSNEQPQIDIKFDIGRAQQGNAWEVVLRIQATAMRGDQTSFHVELSYAGLFGIKNISEDQLQPFLLIDGPAMLFPFARRILADAVRDGGFPPLMLDPIDFAGLYLQQQEQLQQGGSDTVDLPPAPTGNA